MRAQFEVAEAQRTKEEEEYMDQRGNAAVEELQTFVKESKEGKRLLKQTRDVVYNDLKRELKRKGACTVPLRVGVGGARNITRAVHAVDALCLCFGG